MKNKLTMQQQGYLAGIAKASEAKRREWTLKGVKKAREANKKRWAKWRADKLKADGKV